MTGRTVSFSLGDRAGVKVAALVAAALLGCGVKAPPRPPERAGVAGSRHDLRPPGAEDGGPAGEAGPGETGAADGGAGRP